MFVDQNLLSFHRIESDKVWKAESGALSLSQIGLFRGLLFLELSGFALKTSNQFEPKPSGEF